MITRDTLLRAIYSMGSDLNRHDLSNVMTGILAGISMTIKDPELCKRLDAGMRQTWETGLEVPGTPYGPAGMGDSLLAGLKEADNGLWKP